MTPVELNDLLMMTAFVASAGALALYVFPREACKQCAHCRQADWQRKQDNAQRERNRRSEAHQSWHRYHGPTACPFCAEEDQDRGGKVE